MELDQDRVNGLVLSPSENLNVEIKTWIDPTQPEGEGKIAKAALALRNRNGGFLIIGLNNETLMPDIEGRPPDVRATFHLDVIQEIVSRYAQDVFEVAVGFAMRDSEEFPVIGIPEGVRWPVAAKRDLRSSDKKYNLITIGDVYFRTLESNGIPSSTKARAADWREIVQICFENQEADIGRFLRRQLGGQGAARFLELATGVLPAERAKTLRDLAEEVQVEGNRYRLRAVIERNFAPNELDNFKKLSWSISLVIDPQKAEAVSNQEFLNKFFSANPSYSGWPIWLDPRGSLDKNSRPIVLNKSWQALVVSLGGWSPHIDFMRLDGRGRFYLWRTLQDDFTTKVEPGSALDPILVIYRVAEAIAVGLSVAKNLGWGEDSILGFGFRWDGLRDRELVAWANWEVHIGWSMPAQDDNIEAFVEVPAGTPATAIAPYVSAAIQDLFLAFGGYEVPPNVVEHWVQKMVERRM